MIQEKPMQLLIPELKSHYALKKENIYLKTREGFLTFQSLIVFFIIMSLLVAMTSMIQKTIVLQEKFEKIYKNDFEYELAKIDLELNLYYSLEDMIKNNNKEESLMNSYSNKSSRVIKNVLNKKYHPGFFDNMNIDTSGLISQKSFYKSKNNNFILMEFYILAQKTGKDYNSRKIKKNMFFRNPYMISGLNIKDKKNLSVDEIKRIITEPDKEDLLEMDVFKNYNE